MCPRCHSGSIRRSKKKRLLDRVMKWMRMSPYRCRECSHRFYVGKGTDEKIKVLLEWRRRSRVDADASV